MFPIVLHHGLCGFRQRLGPVRLRYFHGRICETLAETGQPVLVTRVHPTAGIATRAAQLKQQILSQLQQIGRGGDRVIVVGHSMGGLDARYMIHRLGMADRVAALLTVSTPHRGSPLADWCVRHLDQRLELVRLIESTGWDLGALRDLTTESCRRFNDETPDSPKVKYFSVSAARPWHLVPAFMVPAFRMIRDIEGPNDSMVSVKSSTWGEHLATWPADHWHTINRRMVIEFRNPTGDIAPYYRRAVDQVAAALMG